MFGVKKCQAGFGGGMYKATARLKESRSSAYFAALKCRILKMIKRTNVDCKISVAENERHFIAVFINRK